MTHPISISTGSLRAPELVRHLLSEAYERYRGNREGQVADYLTALAKVDPDLFGVPSPG